MSTINGKRRLVTGCTGHQIYVIENGARHWVPDLWTMRDHDLNPAELEILSDEILCAIPEEPALASTVPAPRLPEGTVIESETSAWEVRDGKLDPVREPGGFAVKRGLVKTHDAGVAPRTSVYLPLSLLRGVLSAAAPEGGRS